MIDPSSSPVKRPNVVWLLSDQHRGQAMSCAGDPNVNTPHMDRLATEGVWFRNAMSGFPLCCPARGSILTGCYPHRCVPGHEMRLPEGSTTIADVLNDAGYDTAWFGKWHLDGFHEADGRAAFHSVPRTRRGGFRTWIGYENNNAQFDCHVHGHRGDDEVQRSRLPRFETDALTDMLIEHLEHRAESDQPFFAALSVQPPHDPYTAPAKWMRRHNPARLRLRPNVPPIDAVRSQARRELAGYYALIENVDDNLGRIRGALDRLNLTEDTYVVYFSDHGDQHGSHGHFRKCTPFEEAIRVPFIVGGPCHHHYHFPHETDALLNHVDVTPTTLGLCGVNVPETLAGQSLAGAVRHRGLRDNELPEAALLQSVVPTGHPPSIEQPWRGIVTRDGWKYVVFEHGPYLLFDLNNDPHEFCNLAHHCHTLHHRAALHVKLREMLNKLADPFPLFSMS